jgi:hypothetical protein
MELSKAVRTAYFNALDGQITFNALPVPIFDAYALPDGVSYPYILLSSQTSNQLMIKRCKRYNSSILVDIVTGSTDPIGRSDAEDIAEQIDNIINPNDFIDIDLSAYNYQLGNTNRDNDTDLSDKNGLYYIYRKLLTYNFLIIKL